MFTAIKRMLGWQKEPPRRPYAMTDADINALKTFRSSGYFEDFCTFIDAFSAFQAEIMLRTPTDSDLQYMRGYVAALRDLPRVVDNVTKEQVSGPRAESGNAGVNAALYGTSAWTGRERI